MTSTGHARPKGSGDGRLAIFRPDELLVFGNESPGEFVIAVLALIGKAFLASGNEPCPSPALGLSKAACSLAQLVRVRNLLAGRERQEVQKAGINADGSRTNRRNTVRLCVDAQAQIPTRSPLDDTTTLQPSPGDGLLVEAHRADAWHMDACSGWRFERIGKGNAVEPMALAFELGLLGQLLGAPLPGKPGGIQHALQRMAGNAELFAVIGQQIVEGFLTRVDTVLGILFDFSDSPIPDPCKLEQPGIQVLCLRGIEAELELSLDHATPVSGCRCTA